MASARRRRSPGGTTSAKKRTEPGVPWSKGVAAALGIRPLRSDPPPTKETIRAARIDGAIALVVLVISLVTRVFRLDYPAKIVFDEFHFSKFVDEYAAGRYLFDIHPPLGKLLLLAAAKLGGYAVAGPDYKFDSIGKPFGHVIYIPQRLLSATIGSLIPPVLYLTCRTIDIGILPSLTAAVLSITDNLLLTESRLVLTDSQLIFYMQGALYCALNLWKSPKNTPKRYLWLMATAVLAGCAVSTKWTALVTPAMIAFVSLTGLVFPVDGEPLDIAEMVTAGLTAVSVYVTSFYIHFKLLPFNGDGAAFMPCWFRVHLIGSKDCDELEWPSKEPLSFLRSFLYLNKEMYRANKDVKTRHHWESTWFEWMFNLRGVLYSDEATDILDWRERIYAIVNPILAPVALISVAVCAGFLLSTLIRRRQSRASKITKQSDKLKKNDDIRRFPERICGVIFFFLCGYWLNLLPYMAVRRCTFIYHYLPSLQYAIILTALALEVTVPRRLTWRLLASGTIMLLTALAFALYSPWIYAFPLSPRADGVLRRMPRWD